MMLINIRDQHKGLPTVEEQAQWAHEHGAKGILPTKYKDLPINDDRVEKEIKKMEAAGYHPIIDKKNNTGKAVVGFYFNQDGYEQPQKEIGTTYETWSSSVGTDRVKPDFAYVLNNFNGDIYYFKRGVSHQAARCVVRR